MFITGFSVALYLNIVPDLCFWEESGKKIPFASLTA